MSYRIAIDVGGTFTDVVVQDDSGRMHVGKGPTNNDRVFDGISQGLDMVGVEIGVDTPDLLAETEIVFYATTTATNAILEKKTARTAFLVTEGFPDVLVLREAGKVNAYDYTQTNPEPYIPRALTFEISERINAQGEVVEPLDEEQLREVLGLLKDKEIEAVAVCLLWAIENPVHEQRIGELIEEELPGIDYSLSHRVNPIIREYRRASATAIDASLKPIMYKHLTQMESDFREAGFNGELLACTSFGGVMHVEDLATRPIYSVRSGPSLAPVAAREYGFEETGKGDVIAVDTGGTSFDVSLVQDGRVAFTRETWLGPRFTGHMTGLSSVDARSIGAGGGSIAWIDSGGMLMVGPESAGSDPGPACYGRGGDKPTVTDAAVVLGYLDPDRFLGGRMKLDADAARTVVDELSGALGKSAEETAYSIITIANELMVAAIHEITINEGLDPRESVLVAGGGAVGLNIVPIAREVGSSEIVLPRTAGGFSACGALYSNIVSEKSLSKFVSTGNFPIDEVNDVLAQIQEWMDGVERDLRDRGVTEFETQYFVEARYPYQVWEIDVPLDSGRFDGPEDVKRMVEEFHHHHERVFAVKEPGAEIECVNWKGRIIGLLPQEDRGGSVTLTDQAPVPVSHRPAYFGASGHVEDMPVYLGGDLVPGHEIRGPAVIAEPTTTIVVYPHSLARVTSSDNYVLRPV